MIFRRKIINNMAYLRYITTKTSKAVNLKSLQMLDLEPGLMCSFVRSIPEEGKAVVIFDFSPGSEWQVRLDALRQM